jgi:hypothetical protein
MFAQLVMVGVRLWYGDHLHATRVLLPGRQIQMSVADIERFEDILAEKLYALDTEAHAREIGDEAFKPGNYFSVDWFLYERCAVVANGREFHQSVLETPTQMPKDLEFEAILSIARLAYERKTGMEFDHVTPLSCETYSNQTGWRGQRLMD